MKNELLYWLILSSVKNLSIQTKLKALAFLGSPAKVYEADRDYLLGVGFSPANFEKLRSEATKDDCRRIIEFCNKKRIKILTIDDDEYPEMLKYIYDPPLVLYVRGNIPRMNSIAIVGSRRASGYGIETAVKLSSQLALSGFMIVSGMARGIDTAAHCGALKENGTTIAVLGCGVDIPYPPENHSLMERIIESGAVISEYPPGTPPASFNFPGRNRIISGISLGTLVIEAGLKSGSLITAKYALEQGREVFAVPGNINHYNSEGCNRLIKDGAKMVLDVDDIVEELNFGIVPARCGESGKKAAGQSLGKEAAMIISALRIEYLYDEQIAEKTDIPLKNLYEILLDLELKGVVKKNLAGKYMLIT